MGVKLEQVLQQMQELTRLLGEHRDDPGTLDFDQVKTRFAQEIEELTALRVQEALGRQPVRRVAGDAIYAGGAVRVPTHNRYYRAVRDINESGEHRFGASRLKAIDFYLASKLLKEGHALMPDRTLPPSDDLQAALKAMSATGAGAGDELVPTNMAAELWEDFFLASKIAGLIGTVPMPTDPFDVPQGLGDTTWRKGTENTATTATDLTTSKSTLTATELVTELNWSYSLQEDAVVALMPAYRKRLAVSGAEIIDGFALNADSTDSDTGNINSYDDNPANDSYYLSSGQDGIRHFWLVDYTGNANSAAGAALSDAHLASAMADIGKYAAAPRDCAWICDVNTWVKGFLALSNCLTVDKYGPGASILTGEVGAYLGVPIIVSASAPLTRNNGMVYAAGSNAYGQVSILNRNMWTLGFRRELMIEVDRDVRRRQYIMVVSLREAVAAYGTRGTASHTAGIYYILV